MHTTIAKVAVQGGGVAMPIHHSLKFAQIVAQAGRVHGGIFPANLRVGLGRINRQRRGGGTGLANTPNTFLLNRRSDQAV